MPAPEATSSRSSPRTQEAIQLMLDFAERTGLSSERTPQRYLWTDAFAVCNLLGLARVTGEARYTTLALRLVEQVHHTLGRHRPDDSREGWISGLTEEEGEAHPTRGGLRIGKPLPERRAADPFDERLEWERDGQYFHYLTKWTHALDQVFRTTRQPRFNRWARQLAQSAWSAFTRVPPSGGRPRMMWKMSIDLSRPLVSSMGQHDAVDGFVTSLQLQATPGAPSLDEAVAGFASMSQLGDWATADPLGLGGLLTDAWRLAQLRVRRGHSGDEVLRRLLAAALEGIAHYPQHDLHQPASRRLAFRELGLSIGLQALEPMMSAIQTESGSAQIQVLLEALCRYASLGSAIETFWRVPGHRQAATWTEHRDINDVMLATSLAPEGYLNLSPHDAHDS